MSEVASDYESFPVDSEAVGSALAMYNLSGDNTERLFKLLAMTDDVQITNKILEKLCSSLVLRHNSIVAVLHELGLSLEG